MGEDDMLHWGEHLHWGTFGGEWLMILLWISVVALLIWGVITITKSTSRSMTGSEKSQPLDIVKERYAKGEITKEEF